MLTKIQCSNFRGFRELAAPIGAVTAFLGPNSSGKTTALHAVRVACDALRLALAADSAVRLDDGDRIVVVDGELLDPRQLLPLSDWRALFVDQQVGEGVRARIELQFEAEDPIQAVEVTIVCARNAQLKLTVHAVSRQGADLVRALPKKSAHISQRLTAYLREHAPTAVFVPPFYGTIPEEEYRSRAIVDRSLGAGGHVVRNLVVDLDATQFARLNAFLADTLGATLTQRTGVDDVQRVTSLAVHFRDTNGELELSAAGAGLVNLVALYTALSRWRVESGKRSVLFLLDEPEAHLHPRLQADSAARLGQLVTEEFRAQLLLATHSVDILNRLADRGALLLRCDRRATPSVLPLASDAALFDDLAAWVDLTPYTAINFLAGRRVLFCEGTDERELLPQLARLRYRSDPARLARFQRWSIVPIHGAANANLSELLVRLVRNDVVRARATDAEGFRVVLVLDRDCTRTAGTRERVVDGVAETEVVWGRYSLESLLVDPPILAVWLRAFLGDACPADVLDRVRAAASAADADATLNNAAVNRLFQAIHARGGAPKGAQQVGAALTEAQSLVGAAPAVWQSGKDRARFVLGRLRIGLDHAQLRQFPTDIVRLVARADTDRIGDPSAAVPAEAQALLDTLTRS